MVKYLYALEATVDRHPAFNRIWCGCNYHRAHQFNKKNRMTQTENKTIYHPNPKRWYQVEERMGQFYPQYKFFGSNWKYFPFPITQCGRQNFTNLELANLFINQAWNDTCKGFAAWTGIILGTIGMLFLISRIF